MAIKLNGKGKTKANSLIDSGNVDKTSAWSFNADDGNKILGDPPDWGAYSGFHLGIDPDVNQETKAAYHYPFGKNGKIYRSGLIAIRQRSAQQSQTDVFDAAGVLLDKMDGKTSNKLKNLFNSYFSKQSLFNSKEKGFYKVENQTNEATIYIYDEISPWGISAEQFVQDVDSLNVSTLHLRINSPGGFVFDGIAMYNALARSKARVITHIDGIAASISSLLAMGGNEIKMAKNATLMIHRPWGMVIGNEDDMIDSANILNGQGDMIAMAYMKKTNRSKEDILNLMKATTTFIGGQKALEAGFIDSVEDFDKNKAEASINYYDLSIFSGLMNIEDGKISKRTIEKALRDVGVSNKQAKEILAKGYNDDLHHEGEGCVVLLPEAQRDVGLPEFQRDVETAKPKKDRTAELLTRAEMIAPTTT